MSIGLRYLPPNLLTCVSLSLGLMAITEATAHRFDASAWFVLLCVLLDKADGTAARLLKASSRFGVELDSLADLIAFGVAPCILVFTIVHTQPNVPPPMLKFTYVGCFAFAIAAALRLAKFNIVTEEYGPKYFFGWPTTLCGGFVACYFLTLRRLEQDYGVVLPSQWLSAMPIVMSGLALMMVSRIPLPKVRRIPNKAGTLFQMALISSVYVFGFLRIYPEYLLLVCVAYMVIGTLYAVVKGVRPPQLGGDGDSDDTAETKPQSKEDAS